MHIDIFPLFEGTSSGNRIFQSYGNIGSHREQKNTVCHRPMGNAWPFGL